MTDTQRHEWRAQAPTGMYATVSQARCGWHVRLSITGTTMSTLLKPLIVAKSCIPYKPDPTKENANSQAEALAIGLANIAAAVAEECPNL